MLLALASLALAQDPGIRFEVHGWMEVGRPMNVSVEGMAPNQRFYVVYGLTEGVSCPAPIAPTCTDLASTTVLRTAYADANGNAYQIFNFPPVDFMYLQVVTNTDKSDLVVLEAEPDLDGWWINDG